MFEYSFLQQERLLLLWKTIRRTARRAKDRRRELQLAPDRPHPLRVKKLRTWRCEHGPPIKLLTVAHENDATWLSAALMRSRWSFAWSDNELGLIVALKAPR